MTMTIQETEKVLAAWERQDGGWKSEAMRQECIDFIVNHPQSFAWYKDFLLDVPVDITERYTRLMGKLLKKKLIDEYAYQEELKVIHQFTPKELVRRGKEFVELLTSYS